MAAGELDVYTTLQLRNNLGRYLSEIPRKARAAIEAASNKGAEVARSRATVKTGAMRGTIQSVMFGDYSGGFVVGTGHWKYQEDGTAPHEIPGHGHFWWEREGRPWFPGNNTISHPGNPAVHFMQAGADVAKPDLIREVAKEF